MVKTRGRGSQGDHLCPTTSVRRRRRYVNEEEDMLMKIKNMLNMKMQNMLNLKKPNPKWRWRMKAHLK